MVRSLALTAAAVLAAACHASAPAVQQGEPVLVQPGAPGEPSRRITAAEASDTSGVSFSPADVSFMQGMIGHHAQALEMTALAAEHAGSPDLQMLARRIAVSQRDEMAMMRAWLEARGQPVPEPHAMHMPGAVRMPGMLTDEEMARLAAARGAAFDRLFLEGMIKHHEGALTMVRELFRTPGAGQEPELFQFASDVDADQRMEIGRMRALLERR